MAPDFAAHNSQNKSSRVIVRKCLAVVVFVGIIFPAAFATGAGKSNVPCQGTIVSPTDDIVGVINGGKENQTFCIEGEHRITSSINVRSGQSLIGTTPDARISGAVVLTPWQPTSTQGVYYYDGAYAAIHPHQQTQFAPGRKNVCYLVTTYADDLFFRTNPANDQRIMRVLSQAEVDPTQKVTTRGQAVTAGEAGRFFFDYANQRIYLSLPNNQDPNTATVDLSVNFDGSNNVLISGPGQTHVTLQNLFVEKAMWFGLYSGNSWTLQDMTIRFIHNVGAYNISGVAGGPATIDDTLFTSIGRTAINAGFTSNIVITNSEMSWTNIANFRSTTGQPGSGQCQGYNDAGPFHIYDDVGTSSQPAVTINNLWSHDNIGDGLWSDGGSQYIQITNSTFSGNERYGYLHEISCQLQFANNTVYSNGYSIKNPDITGGGVNVSDSNLATFSSNLLYDNYPGFAFHLSFQDSHSDMMSNACLGAHSDGDTSNALKNNQVLNNAIYSCSGDTSIGKVWGAGGPLNSRGNQYQSNQYHLADSTTSWFSDANSNGNYVPQDWSAWQQGNHDTQGSLAIGCTYQKGKSKEQVLFNFSSGGDPNHPYAALTFDKAGNLYGTTQSGGAYNQGSVFELMPSAGGWTETVLYNFTGGTDGGQPTANVVFDASGRLHGTTSAGGGGSCNGGCGTVFQLTPGYSGWKEAVLYTFSGGSDGREPHAGLTVDAAGNLYGTTVLGGSDSSCSSGCGTVFKLSNGAGGWNYSVLHAFKGDTDGVSPYAGVTFDKAGNLYGTTFAGGASGKGIVFKLTSAYSGWTESVLYAFRGNDGAAPKSGLVLDAANNLYGTTFQGGAGYGVVFKLGLSNGAWREQVLHRFADAPAAGSVASLAFDRAGNLYGTTMLGASSGSCPGGCGTLFRLTAGSGGAWTFNVLHVFGRGSDGFTPSSNLIADTSGNLYGTTQAGGAHGEGVVFALMP